MNTPIKAVLLSKDEKNYGIVKNLLTTIDNNRFELEWIVLEQTQIRSVIFHNYQVYLIDDHLWINPNQEPSQKLASLQKYLFPLINQISPTPVILLTDNSSLGKATLELGIEDYWDKNELTPSIVERSLRLTLKNTYQNSNQERALEEKNLKQKIRELEEYKNRYEAAIEAREEIFYDWNSQTNQVFWGGNIQEILGYCANEIVNHLDWWKDLIHPEDRLKFAVAIEEMRETREPIKRNYRVRGKDGKYILVEDIGKFFRDSQGKWVRMAGFIKDITDSQQVKKRLEQQEKYLKNLKITEGKEIEENFRHNEEKLRRLMDSLPVCIAYTDREILQQAEIQSYLNFPIIIDQVSQDWGGEILWGILYVQQCRNSRQWTTDEIDLLKQIATQLSIALKQAQLRQQKMAQREELTRSNQDLEQFAYIVSHDLQEPLGIISSYGQLLQRHCQKQLDPKAETYIDRMLNSVKRMHQQIEDLLQYSRIGTRKQTLQLIDSHSVLRQAIANLEIPIKKQNAQIEIITPLPTLRVDPSQLVQLWQNLISNAIKYHKNIPPVIKINCQRQKDKWLFSIQDNGIGIEPQYYERIFQVFQRLHTQEDYPGTGIGLAICQRIVDRHGGRIWVESELGKGATFYFTIAENQD